MKTNHASERLSSMVETQDIEKKSIKVLQSDLSDIAHIFVCFANARGGKILIGIENEDELPPAEQKVSQVDIDKVNKRVGELTYNVGVSARKVVAGNGGEYIEVIVFPSEVSIAATRDGRYFIRVGDSCLPVVPDELNRLVTEKGFYNWELKLRNESVAAADLLKHRSLIGLIRSSERVSQFVKQKSDDEILEYFYLSQRGKLTNLGVLWIGSREDRARLNYPPAIQFIKYDELEKKVKKLTWTDSSLNPLELVEAVWNQVDEWREFYEITDGIFRQNIPHYEEAVIRELLVNALIHRPYNIRGDIYINMYPDRLEITNPGRLPIGVTPQNILHTRQHRNTELCNLCYHIKLMEKEGSGYDMIYEKLVVSGKPVPVVREGTDSVTVIVYKKVIDNRIVKLLSSADKRYELTQREKITLGVIAQSESIQVTDLVKKLDLPGAEELQKWIGSLKTKALISSVSRTKGTRYQVNPDFLKSVDFKGRTTLMGIEGHRLRELILTDLQKYKISSINEIHKRIGEEIPIRRLRTELRAMIQDGLIQAKGNTRWRQYLLTKSR